MCRAISQGGRRCPGCHNQAARDAHNARRRLNRAIKAEALKNAMARSDIQSSELQKLKAMPPGQAKAFALEKKLNVPRDVKPQPAFNPPKEHPLREHAGDPVPSSLQTHAKALTALQGTHSKEATLLSGEVSSATWFNAGGVNETTLVEFTNGERGFFKSFHTLDDACAEDYGQKEPLQPIHEAAAWQVAKTLGPRYESLVPPCVITEINGHGGSLAQGVPGIGFHPAHPGLLGLDRKEINAAALFDAVIGQQDRHPGNFLVDGDGRIHLIDHGFTFARQKDQLNFSAFQRARYDDPKSRKLLQHERKSLEKLVASDDLQGLLKALKPKRAAALKRRVQTMLSTGEILKPGEYF